MACPVLAGGGAWRWRLWVLMFFTLCSYPASFLEFRLKEKLTLAKKGYESLRMRPPRDLGVESHSHCLGVCVCLYTRGASHALMPHGTWTCAPAIHARPASPRELQHRDSGVTRDCPQEGVNIRMSLPVKRVEQEGRQPPTAAERTAHTRPPHRPAWVLGLGLELGLGLANLTA